MRQMHLQSYERKQSGGCKEYRAIGIKKIQDRVMLQSVCNHDKINQQLEFL